MPSPPDPFSIDAYVLLDAGVLRDVADALDGRWDPPREPDPLRAERLLAAARLRLYGDRDRAGWRLVSYRAAIEAAISRGDTEWSVGFLPDVEQFDDGPATEEVTALARLYSSEDILPEAALALAHAVLYEPIRLLVTTDVRPYRHSRETDLPARLELVTAIDAVARLELQEDEEPRHRPPASSALASQEPWWVP